MYLFSITEVDTALLFWKIKQIMPITPDQARINGAIAVKLKKVGRPLGVASAEKRLKAKSEKLMLNRLYRASKKILDAQIIVATGSHKIIQVYEDKNTGEKKVKTIRDEAHIQKLLDEGEYGKDYMVVVGALPNGDVANKLLDRAFGKAKETLDINADVKFSLKDLAEQRKKIFEGEISERGSDAVASPMIIDAIAIESNATESNTKVQSSQ